MLPSPRTRAGICTARRWARAVRNLEQAGVPRSVAMKLTGHKTESVYRRDAIADDRDLRVAVEKLDALATKYRVKGEG